MIICEKNTVFAKSDFWSKTRQPAPVSPTIVYTIVIVSNQCSDRPTQYTLLMMHSASLSPKIHSSDQMLGFVA